MKPHDRGTIRKPMDGDEPIPEGYHLEYAGEYRPPVEGEWLEYEYLRRP